jgi:C-terminal peptidase prc
MSKVKLAGLRATLVLVVVLFLNGAIFPTAAKAAEERSGPYVVLVGVSQYADKQIKPRPHAEADAQALYDTFVNKGYGAVKADHVKLLLGSADPQRRSEPATHANIIKALKWLASNAQRDDLAIFAFIGQGAPLNEAGNRLCYLASDSTLKDRVKNAVAAADIQQELDKLKSQRFCAFIDVYFKGYESGPEKLPEPVLGANAFREFLGTDAKEGVEGGKEDQATALGRALFLATSGLHPSIDTPKHGLFTKILVDGLHGAADKEGYEPDGVVTVSELGEYLEKEIQEQGPKLGKTDEERKQAARFYESRGSHFVLTHNPAVAGKVAERLQKLAELAREKKLTPEFAAEGKDLLSRMPKLKAYQDLRRQYQRLVDAKLTTEQFAKERGQILSAMKLGSKAAKDYAAKIIQATEIIKENYVKEVNQGDLVAWAIRGVYRALDEKIPADIGDRLEKARQMKESELQNLLADFREKLGQREDLDDHKDLDLSLQRMLANLDPYTTYYDPETLARFRQDTSGEFRGIGIQIHENRLRGGLEVVTPLKGSPAYKAGIWAGDLITQITKDYDKDGHKLPQPEVVSTKGMTTNEAVKQIQGKPGTKVKLTIEREGVDKPLEVEVARDVIEIETVLGSKRNEKDDWDFYVDPANKIAYIRLSTFARKTSRDLLKAVNSLNKKGINGLILDLRFNPGGLLNSAVEISDMFIDDGVIVKIRNRAGKEVIYPGEHEGSFLDFPMVCLVNNMSASGSEIVSACLQDHERALVMGERSYGKGSVQNIQSFAGGELKFTTASFWRPSGKNLNKSSTHGREDEDWGVIPNRGYVLNLSEKDREQLFEHLNNSQIIPRRDLPPKEKKVEFKDRQLEMALDYLRSQIRTAAKATAKRAG